MVQKQAVIVAASNPIKVGIEMNLTFMLMMKVVHINFPRKPKITPYRLKVVHRQHWVGSWNASSLLGSKDAVSSGFLFAVFLVVKKLISSNIFGR
jgi:hypothetical protein